MDNKCWMTGVGKEGKRRGRGREGDGWVKIRDKGGEDENVSGCGGCIAGEEIMLCLSLSLSLSSIMM